MSDTNPENLKILYSQLCESYHKVDDFRAKLLGFLPLASGATLLGILHVDKNDKVVLEPYLTEIGWFGILITTGLLIYELKGIQKCTGFIYSGMLIEKELMKGLNSKLTGHFSGLWEEERLWQVITEPVASALVYSTVLAVWVYVATLQINNTGFNYTGMPYLAAIVGLIVTILIYLFWRLCSKPEAYRQADKDPKLPESDTKSN